MDVQTLPAGETDEHTTSSFSDEDARLVAAAQRNRVRFVALYDKYFLRVYRYISQRVGTQQDVEDLTSQVFVEAMESLDDYHEQGVFAAWLFSIARRRVADHYRRSVREPPLERVEARLWSSTDRTSESRVVQSDRLERLVEAFQALALEKQEMVRLRFFAGLGYREIALLMDKSEGAVKMTVRRALEELRRRMRDEEE